jgi:hypothetical protein
MTAMERPLRFEHNRWVGDKRTQVVHDIDNCKEEDEPHIKELLDAQTYICFGPDTDIEAANRGYRRCGQCAGPDEQDG